MCQNITSLFDSMPSFPHEVSWIDYSIGMRMVCYDMITDLVGNEIDQLKGLRIDRSTIARELSTYFDCFREIIVKIIKDSENDSLSDSNEIKQAIADFSTKRMSNLAHLGQDIENRGLFIVLEGGDRSGKSTQAAQLHQYISSLDNSECTLRRFPERSSPSGQILDAFLKANKDLNLPKSHIPWISHALFAYNRWEHMPIFLDELKKRHHIVCDRYSFSGVTYSNVAQNLPAYLTGILELGLLKPDAVLQPVVDYKDIENRGGFGQERYETSSLQARVHEYFERFASIDYWYTVDGRGTISQVFASLKKLCEEKLLNRSVDTISLLSIDDMDP